MGVRTSLKKGQGGWQDLFVNLLKLTNAEPEIYEQSLLINVIREDAYFTQSPAISPGFYGCNLNTTETLVVLGTFLPFTAAGLNLHFLTASAAAA
jgi:hypothetical protein